ncbi:MAG: bifunctional pyr operon transcriptional regulator/uracil phosphoribosyltransferase PyrR [Deltaproteobacteria bacterium]|nr:bifunctional pyr operon transcriptional regulator/uracil phosphoribosyltransferase PyrR [Deltaproteobacteria bacterium]
MALARDILNRHDQSPILVGIRRGGVTLAERLSELMAPRLGLAPPVGIIDINLYRDDWTLARSFPKVGRTEIAYNIEDRRVVLVDDVLYTGRTVRAALDALTEFGRPGRVELAVLVDRGCREMPIQADYAAFVVGATPAEMVEVKLSADGSQDEVLLLTPAAAG